MAGYGQIVETVERWRRFPARERVQRGVALTFDDGPDPDATPAVLDVLERARAHATFFLVGEQLLVHHNLGRAVADAGHELALHGFRHVEHDELDNPREDLLRGLDAIESATGARPGLFRPPYGRFSEASFAACLELELEPVYWSAWGMGGGGGGAAPPRARRAAPPARAGPPGGGAPPSSCTTRPDTRLGPARS